MSEEDQLVVICGDEDWKRGISVPEEDVSQQLLVNGDSGGAVHSSDKRHGKISLSLRASHKHECVVCFA